MSTPWFWTFGEVPEISADHVLEYVNGKCTDGNPLKELPDLKIVDVRTVGEYTGGHIEGAVSCSLIPPWSFRERLIEGCELKKEKAVLAICLSAHRSIAAVRLLRQEGFEKSFQLKGGMQAWRALQYPEVKEETQTTPNVDNNSSNNNNNNNDLEQPKKD